MSRFLSPLTLLAGLWLGVGLIPLAAQDIPTPSKDPKAVIGPKPRTVGEEKKQPPKPEAPKPEEPKKLTFEPVVPARAEQKADDEPKKEDPKAEEKDEPKKEEPKKEDPLAAVDKKAGDAATAATTALQHGDNAWILVSSALVLLMTPGLALFYGGMVRRKNVLATMMQSYAAMAVVGLYWVAVGYGLAFGESQIICPDGIATTLFGDDAKGGGIIGWSNKLFFLKGVEPTEMLPGYNIPVLTHVMFQGMFAIITPALISGAVAERIRFWPWTIFMILWITVVYCPLAHMVWAFDWFYMDPATPGRRSGRPPPACSARPGPWTSPAGPWCTSPPGSPGWRASSP